MADQQAWTGRLKLGYHCKAEERADCTNWSGRKKRYKGESNEPEGLALEIMMWNHKVE